MRVDIGDGVRLFFDVEGPKLVPHGPVMVERPTMLLLHGGPGFDHSLFKPWWSVFADTHQVIYLDQRGHGRSDQRDDPAGWNLTTWADDVVRFCDALDIERPVVFGNSFGGTVAMLYAARHPDHPSKLVLSSATGKHDSRARDAAFERLGGPEAAAIARRFFDEDPDGARADYARVCLPLYNQRPLGNPAAALDRTLRNHAIGTHYALGERNSLDLLGQLSNIRCPTLVLAGELDPVCPIAYQQALLEHLPPELVRFELMRDCGHGTYRDQPDRTMRVLREFLAEG
jgi:pimeloyl-ACP methyl ester carboxylesterase